MGPVSIWDSMTNAGSSLPIGGTDSGAARHDGRMRPSAMLRYFMHRHQSLRTRIVTCEDGRDAPAGCTSGTVPLEVVDAGDADPGAVARAGQRPLLRLDFDYGTEWPIRMAAVA